jgi:membrane protein YqaA with SNARE-associated domain
VSVFRGLLSWWGLFVLGAIDATLAFFVPFGIDTAVIYLASRRDDLIWLYPLMATAGSLAGAATTFWLGARLGEKGLARFVNDRQLERFRTRVRKSGAFAIAIPALLPPPFPLKPFVLTCGALKVERTRFFATFAGVRAIRFGGEAVLAYRYGERILTVLESDTFGYVVLGLVAVAIIGTVVSAVLIWRKLSR